jgi:predicted O-methyltransferase YrrM
MADKLFQFQSYLNMAFSGRSKYYIHSPFVFKLILEVIDNKSETPATEGIKAHRAKLSERKEQFSSIVPGLTYAQAPRESSIAYLNKNASVPHAYGRFLHHLVTFTKAKQVLEIGSCIGISSAYMASAYQAVELTMLEGNPLRAKASQEILQDLHINNVRCEVGLFSQTLPKLCTAEYRWDLVFMDGHHEYQATKDYFNQLLPVLHEGSCVVMDDIYWSKGMNKAWNECRMMPKVMLSVDLYRMGLLFFEPNRKEQEHFKLFMNLR